MRWYTIGLLLVLSFIILFFCVAERVEARDSTKLDVYFYKYSKLYFGPGFDWKWFRAQGQAESNLNSQAVSPVGARGVMQIMPGTWREICRKQKITAGITEARWNIAAGIFYDQYLWGQWRSKRPDADRLALMFASYNAGLGTILTAQKLCMADCRGDCNLWGAISEYDHEKWIGKETRGYVKRIFRFMGEKY